jgi:hypothetical protein
MPKPNPNPKDLESTEHDFETIQVYKTIIIILDTPGFTVEKAREYASGTTNIDLHNEPKIKELLLHFLDAQEIIERYETTDKIEDKNG